jgi:hypothetical protein
LGLTYKHPPANQHANPQLSLFLYSDVTNHQKQQRTTVVVCVSLDAGVKDSFLPSSIQQKIHRRAQGLASSLESVSETFHQRCWFQLFFHSFSRHGLQTLSARITHKYWSDTHSSQALPYAYQIRNLYMTPRILDFNKLPK